MKLNNLLKYIIRFMLLQFVVTFSTIYYFNYYLIPDIKLFPDREITFRQQIDANLLEDAARFFPNIPENLIKLDIVIGLFVFLFLIFFYSTKFYTYVNELSFSIDKNYLDEYFSLYLTWTSSLMIFVTLLRFGNLVSRGNLLILTFVMPVILLVFRNSEFLSSLFGRSVTGEKYLTFNMKEDSVFRNLRILTFRKKIKDININDITNSQKVIDAVDKVNKKENVNLIVLNFENFNKINKKLENYLVNLNKKVLIISKRN